MQCEGQRRYGGAFSMGRPVWKRCENEAVATLFVRQDKQKRSKPMPSCMKCWSEALTTEGITITRAEPSE